MRRIEIHQHEQGIWLDVVLPADEAALEMLQLLEAVVEAVGTVGLDTLYPAQGPVTLFLSADVRSYGYVVRTADGTEVDGDSFGFSSLADRIQERLSEGLFIINP